MNMVVISINSRENIFFNEFRFDERLSIWEKFDYQTDAYSLIQEAVRAFKMKFGNQGKNHLKAEKQDSPTQTFSQVSIHRKWQDGGEDYQGTWRSEVSTFKQLLKMDNE